MNNSQEVVMHKDLVYRSDSERGRVDVILPQETPRPYPVVICLHGGGWMEGSKDSMRLFGSLLAEMGIAAVLPNYRLTVTHAYPAQEEDVFAVLQWVADQAGVYGFDPNRVGLLGASAGAHLACLAGMKATRSGSAGPCKIRCILAVCGVSDIGLWARDKPPFRGYMEAFVGGPLEERLDVVREASPVTHVHAQAPAVRCVHGALDATVPTNQSEVFVTALRAAGVDAELCITPNDGHAMTTGSEGTDPLGGREGFVDFFTGNLLYVTA